MSDVLPHDLDAERSVLGALLVDPGQMDAVAEILACVDFYRQVHGWVFEAALSLHLRQEPVDFLTIKAKLEAMGRLDSVGAGYLSSLTDGVPRSSNAPAYARIVRDKALRRELVQAAHRAIVGAHNVEHETADVLDKAQQALMEIGTQRATHSAPLGDVMVREVMPLIEKWASEKRTVSGVPSGLIDLDVITRGFQPTDLILLGARPAVGKTALILNTAMYAATHGTHVGIFSLEMSRSQLGMRALIAESRIDAHRVYQGRMRSDETPQFVAAQEKVFNAPIDIDDRSLLTVHDVRAQARRWKALKRTGLIIVDYIQLMKATQRAKSADTRHLELDEISAGLKAIAKDLNVPVIALAQLSRSCESRADKRPMLSDLRDSGGLEANADIVMFLYRDEIYDKQSPDAGTAEIHVAKHRNGPVATVKVGFEGSQTRFFNLQTQGMVA